MRKYCSFDMLVIEWCLNRWFMLSFYQCHVIFFLMLWLILFLFFICFVFLFWLIFLFLGFFLGLEWCVFFGLVLSFQFRWMRLDKLLVENFDVLIKIIRRIWRFFCFTGVGFFRVISLKIFILGDFVSMFGMDWILGIFKLGLFLEVFLIIKYFIETFPIKKCKVIKSIDFSAVNEIRDLYNF